jgi:hypothetical protein
MLFDVMSRETSFLFRLVRAIWMLAPKPRNLGCACQERNIVLVKSMGRKQALGLCSIKTIVSFAIKPSNVNVVLELFMLTDVERPVRDEVAPLYITTNVHLLAACCGHCLRKKAWPRNLKRVANFSVDANRVTNGQKMRRRGCWVLVGGRLGGHLTHQGRPGAHWKPLFCLVAFCRLCAKIFDGRTKYQQVRPQPLSIQKSFLNFLLARHEGPCPSMALQLSTPLSTSWMHTSALLWLTTRFASTLDGYEH